MIINKQDTAIFDTDGTLVKWVDGLKPTAVFIENGYKPLFIGGESASDSGILTIDFYGMPKYCREITVHTEFLKSLKARGYYIRVHSGNGAEWAANVVKALKLEDYVDSVETKPAKVIDDKPCDDWCHPIYLGDT